MTKIIMAIVVLLASSSVVLAWTGQDISSGNEVEIEQNNLVRAGRDIEVYDVTEMEYHDVTVEAIHRSGSHATVEVYDYDTNEYHELEMDD